MQKKIIALAIASALTMPAMAMAAPTVYGEVNMAYEITDTGSATNGTGTAAAKRNNVSSNFSRLGFKGSEDLGNGLTGVYQMEGQVMTDTGNHDLFHENTFLGLAGDFGTVVLGNHDTPYKLSTRGMDVFEDTIADNRSLMGLGGINLDVSATDVLAYLTPNFDGFSAAVAIVGETDNTLAGAATAVNAAISTLAGNPADTMSTTSVMTLSAQYAQDNWSAVLGHIAINMKNAAPIQTADKVDVTGTKLGGTYAMDQFAVNGVYEMAALDVSGTKVEQNNLYISGTYAVSDMGTVKLAYTMAGTIKADGTDIKNSGATQVSLGYDHAMTENTTLFAAYTSISNDTNAAYGLTTEGSTAVAAAGANDDDPSAISFGVRHSF